MNNHVIGSQATVPCFVSVFQSTCFQFIKKSLLENNMLFSIGNGFKQVMFTVSLDCIKESYWTDQHHLDLCKCTLVFGKIARHIS